MTFAITERKTLKLTSAKPRKEFHGDESVQAIDLKFSGAFDNSTLSLFHAALPAALFTAEGPSAVDDVQQEMDLPVSDLSSLRFKKLRFPIKWDHDIIGAKVSIYWGTGKPLVIPLCKVTDFQFEPIDGGLVTIDFRVSSAADITERILGRTGIMAGDDVEITLEPPVVEVEKPAPARAPAAPVVQQTPESIFMESAEPEAVATAGDEGGWPFPNDPPGVVQ